MYEVRKKVLWFAVLTRISILILQVIFNVLCPDHNANAFRTPADPTEKHTLLDNIVTFLLGGLTRWDAQYFIHIAKYGYTYENTLAFFPLFPMLIEYMARVFRIQPPILNYSNIIVICGVIINFVCFVKAALVLYDLSLVVFKNTKVAYRAAILFCVNPASIFFTALYTESLFAYLTFYSMLESINNNPCVFLPLSLSSLVRSNGLVNLGFPVYFLAKKFKNKHFHSSTRSLLFNSRHVFISLFQIIFIIILSLLPFGYSQVYNYIKFCKPESNESWIPYHVKNYAIDNNLLLPGQHDFAWCNSKLPIAYSHIQNKYWNVGFLRYYEFKQIPNFLLAVPVICIILKCCIEFFKEHRSKFLTLEFFSGISRPSDNIKRYPLEMFVFVVHALFLTTFCIFFVHIQVSTRLLCSASPVLFWYCALTTLEDTKMSKKVTEIEYDSPENMCSRWKVFFITEQNYSYRETLIYRYFLSYFVIGCFMYANFLPWT
ncbi:GPI mannosyltransferase 2-like [Phymastichus coffea]|uniref:GPI mannosyltransferase 2-like n=1 Tax=Phymastichus coffea TaxID=108790 RepID=UPI00273B5406|nr:GPI mannosyltransferase 2-like [Phymastichus coffea]